jgi:uncharacterized membrane protein YfhO
MDSLIEAPDREVRIIEWSAERKMFSIGSGSATELRLKTFYYPYWTATTGERTLPTRPAQDGALLVSAPPDETIITVQFKEPLSTSLAGAVSLCGLLLSVLLLALDHSGWFGERRKASWEI